MKAITLLLTFTLLLTGLRPAPAGCPPTPTSYCVTIPLGFSMMANHLAGPMRASALLGTVPQSTTVYTLSNPGGISVSTYDTDLGGWDPSEPSIGHGEGVIVFNPGASSFTTTIAGTFQTPSLPLNLNPGFHLLGRQVVGLGTVENILGYPPGGCPGLEVYRINPIGTGNFLNPNDPNAYIKYTYNGIAWSPATPVLNVGEAAWFKITGPCSGVVGFSASAVVPSVVGICGSFTLQILGSSFQSGATVVLKKSGQTDITASPVTVTGNGFALDATVNLTSAMLGAWDVEVTNPGGAVQMITGSLMISTPSVTGINPAGAGACAALPLKATGAALCLGSIFKLVRSGQADIVGTAISINPFGNEITGIFNVVGAAPGAWDVVVIHPSGSSSMLAGAFNIGSAAAAYAQFQPTQGFDCAPVTLSVLGVGICPGTLVKLARTGQSDLIGSAPVVNVSQSSLSATFNLFSALPGPWDVVVTPPGGPSVVLPGAFTVNALSPIANVVVPNHGGNCGPATVSIGGGGLVGGLGVKLQRSGQADIPGSTPTVNGLGNALTTQFNLTGAALGLWDVVLTCPSGSAFTLPGAFTVKPMALHLITPVAGKDCNTVGVTLSGSCFVSGATVKLKKTGSTPITGVTTVINSSTISSVFNLTGAATGLWDLEVTNPNGNVATLPAAFTVLPCTGCAVDVALSGPSLIGAGRHQTFSICYKNNGATPLNNVNLSVGGIPADAIIKLVSASPVATVSSPVALPQTISFTVPSIGAGQQLCFYFTLQFPTIRPPVLIIGQVTSPCLNTDIFQCEVLASYDPNDKTGLPGSGPSHFILGTETLPYTVTFENKASATAPAQEVFITDRVDPVKLDLATFSLGTVTWGTHSVTAPAGLTLWTTFVPHSVNANPADDIVVKIDAKLVTNPIDPNYGRLTWALRSLDPITLLLPSSPLRGFLPPNVTPPQGDGSVSYSVKAKPSLVTGDNFGNNASIVFDLNPAILTPVWINSIDKTAPVSSVALLSPVQYAATFNVSWSGTDAPGSGIASYDVFVSDNSAPATAFLTGTTATSAPFTGLDGHTYAFHSVATDLLGHVETVPAAPDTTTIVNIPIPCLSIALIPGNNVLMSWPCPGVLQEASMVTGPWSDVAGATSPHTAPIVGGAKFYKLRP